MTDAFTLEIRRLNSADLDRMVRINFEHKKNMGLLKKDSYDDLFINNMNKYFEKQNRYVLGGFFAGELVSYIGVVRWPNMPCWTFTTAKAKIFWRSNMKFRPEMNGISSLIRSVIREESSSGRSIYWFLTSLKRNQGHRKYWSLSIPELRDYYLISRIIEKNYRPADPYIWSLMGEQIWNENLIVRIGVQKNRVEDLKPFFNLLQIPFEKMNLENEDTDLSLHSPIIKL